MTNVAAKLLADAMHLPEDEREELAAKLLDSLEPPPGISIDDRDEIEARANEAEAEDVRDYDASYAGRGDGFAAADDVGRRGVCITTRSRRSPGGYTSTGRCTDSGSGW
jgi:hypothetical protein